MEEIKMRTMNQFWRYRWNVEGDKPTVLFTNPKILTNIVFDFDDLDFLVRTYDMGRFYAIPLDVMQASLIDLQNIQSAELAA